MREIRLSGSEGGGTGNSTGPPYPYPTSTVVGGRNWPWPRWWGGCGGWWWWRTLERPGWRSHAGAWERSENDQHDQKDQHDQRGGTIDDQNGAHGAAYVGPGVGCRGQRGGVGQGRGVGQTETARQRRLPGRVGRWRQAGRSGLGFAATGDGGQTGQTGAEEQHGGGFGDNSKFSYRKITISTSGGA